MKITALEMSNFKRIEALSINPDGTLCVVSGKNGAGKSTLIDSIEAAFGGAAHSPEDPIRKGQNEARVIVETDSDPDMPGIRIERRWKRGQPCKLVVESREGDLRYPGPQKVLDRLYSAHTLDPAAFTRMTAAEQVAKLRAVVGLDTSKLDAERERVYATRTGANATVKSLNGQIENLVIPEAPAEVGEEVDLVSIGDKKTVAANVSHENERKRAAAIRSADVAQKAAAEITRLEALLAAAHETYQVRSQEAVDAKEAAEGLVDPDVSTIEKEIEVARQHNLDVRARQFKARAHRAAQDQADGLKKQLEAAQAKQDELNDRLDKIDAEKAAMLAAAKFPVTGMGIDGDTVMLNGVPFSEASTAEQIRCGLAMGAALNPRLKVVLIREGSLLDDDSMRLVAEEAEAKGLQVFVERIAGANEGVGIEIVDGMLAHKEAATATA